jgi:hypothetical protein
MFTLPVKGLRFTDKPKTMLCIRIALDKQIVVRPKCLICVRSVRGLRLIFWGFGSRRAENSRGPEDILAQVRLRPPSRSATFSALIIPTVRPSDRDAGHGPLLTEHTINKAQCDIPAVDLNFLKHSCTTYPEKRVFVPLTTCKNISP